MSYKKIHSRTKMLQLAMQNLQAGDLQQAETLYRQVLAQIPNNAEANHFLGVIACQHGRFETGVRLMRKAIKARPDYAEAHKNLGKALKELKLLDEALISFQKALSIRPDHAEALNDLGNVFYELRRVDEAISCFRKSLAIRPDFFIALNNLGNILQEKGFLEEAITCFEKALAVKPGFPVLYFNLGNALKDKGSFNEAVAYYKKAIAIKPDYAEALNNLGIALKELGQLEEAALFYHKAIAITPDYAEAMSNLCVLLGSQAKVEEALAYLRKALRYKPDFTIGHSNVLYLMNYVGKLSQKEIYEESLRWDTQHAKALLHPSQASGNKPDAERKLRIGYVSPDFRDHSVAYFVEPVIQAHNREALEIFCYANVNKPDMVTERLKALADHWSFIAGNNATEIAEKIRLDEIDILVDLAGHSLNNSLLAFAHKPAPIQISWLGYPNTTGMQAMDYRLTDAVADPVGDADRLHSEKLVRLENGFLCYGADKSAPAPAKPPFLQQGYITFGSFNNLAKLGPEVVQSWAEILRNVPGSHLLLKSKQLSDAATHRRFLHLFAEQGIDPSRLKLYGWLPDKDGHLGLYSRVDIALDPFPYNGTTTTCEAMWMGVPVVTLLGDRHVGRVGASIMHQIGLEEFVASSIENYVQLAAAIARDQERLAGMRKSLRQRLLESKLMDKRLFTKTLESAYRQMWRKYCESM